jgi:hypothetical protein
MWDGYDRGAPEEALYEVVVIYIIFPFLWSVVSCGVIFVFGVDRIVRVFTYYLLPCCFITIIYYYIAFFAYGPAAVSFIAENSNALLTEKGGIEATMHVYGPLIFIVGGVLSSYELIKNMAIRYSMVAIAFTCSIISGRSALILTCAIGLLLHLLFTRYTQPPNRNASAIFGLIVMRISGAIIAMVAVITLASALFNIDAFIAFDELSEKLRSGGGSQRAEQFYSLLDGIYQHSWFGAGHGQGASYYSSVEKPWRYELVWVATLYRTGIAGFVIYAIPFAYCLVKYTILLRRGQLTGYERFIFAGYICALLASNTNPYLEAIVMQWMFVLPSVYILDRPWIIGPNTNWTPYATGQRPLLEVSRRMRAHAPLLRRCGARRTLGGPEF